jgi:multimeric flavodoxin WrbA
MKITVLNGSPKGEQGVTLQSVFYIQRMFPGHRMEVFHPAQRIRTLEDNRDAWDEVIGSVKSSDGVLWAFPLYYFLVHSGYKRFIEVVHERGAEEAFSGKRAAVLSTSINFFDHTAHAYMRAVCDDLDMRFAGAYSAEMGDLLREEERRRLLGFAAQFFRAIETDAPAQKQHNPLPVSRFRYKPGTLTRRVDTEGKRVIILTDQAENGRGNRGSNLAAMVGRVKEIFGDSAEILNLNDIDIRGGCLGCIRCGYDYRCAYEGKDGYIDAYNNKIKPADVVVYAGSIVDRYLSSRWKLFFDRSFFNTHTPSLAGKQFCFVVSGPLREIPNLSEILMAYTELQRSNFTGVVTDEESDSGAIDRLLEDLAERATGLASMGYIRPRTFLGIGGSKIFRDEIWGRIRFPFMADHKYYRRNGLYDFPRRDLRSQIFHGVMGLLTRFPRMRQEIYARHIIPNIVKAHREVVEKAHAGVHPDPTRSTAGGEGRYVESVDRYSGMKIFTLEKGT